MGRLDFPPAGPRYVGGHALWLTQRPNVTYGAVGRELLWSANIMQVDRTHSHLRDDRARDLSGHLSRRGGTQLP